MKDDLRLVPLEDRGQPVGTDVNVVEAELLAVGARFDQVADPAARKVVDGDNAFAFRKEALAQVRPDEPRPPGDERGGHASANPGDAATARPVVSPRASRW